MSIIYDYETIKNKETNRTSESNAHRSMNQSGLVGWLVHVNVADDVEVRNVCEC